MALEERVAALEEARDNIYHQIGEVKEEVKDLRGLTSAVERLTVSVQNMGGKVDKIDERLGDMEKAPADDLKHYKRLIIGNVIAGIIGAIIGAVLALILK